MVYAPPPQVVSSVAPLTAFRPAHRRTRSHNVVTSSTPMDGSGGSGAFTPMAHLPRRKSARKAFYLEDEPPSPDEDDPASLLSPLGIDTSVHTFPSILSPSPVHDHHDPSAHSVPFPRTRDGAFSPPPAIQPSSSPRPSLSRTPSSPVILSNGKPLKPSLKSQSAPDLPEELRVHLRAKSEPSTPSIKSVHFRDDDEIEDVKVYNRTGRPANLLVKPGEETETETEVEGAFPFPRALGGMGALSPTISPPSDQLPFVIDCGPGQSSAVPRAHPDPLANVHLESISLPQARPAAIKGSIVVRNVAFEKNVVVRFTLDDWQTTSEVACKHVASLPCLPPSITVAGQSASAWDRFSFQISLEDYVSKLSEKTVWLVVRYTSPGHGEWWDNNAHGNYRVAFQKVAPVPDGACNRQQGSFVAPTTLRTTPQSSPLVLSSIPPSLANVTPGLYPSAVTGKLTSSPRGSPAASPRISPRISPNGSPPQSDSENRKPPARRRANVGFGLGINGSARPPALTRSMSSPPVFTPPPGAYANGFMAPAAPPSSTRGAPPSRQQVDGNLSPLMARLSRLSLSNYSAPSRPAPVSEEERASHSASSDLVNSRQELVAGHVATFFPDPSLAMPDVKVTVSSPSATADAEVPSPSLTPKPSQAMRIPSPLGSPSLSPSDSAETLVPTMTTHSPSTSPAADSSTSTSATSSPLLSTPRESSLTDIPSLDVHAHPRLESNEQTWMPLTRADSPLKQRRERRTSGTDSFSAPRTTYQSPDLVLNMPTPAVRGAVNSPFSPVSTPRFSLDSALLAAGARASPSLTRSRMDTNDADYTAFVRQWCFARSPSPGNTPVATPKEEALPQQFRTVRVQVSVPRTESPLRATESVRTTPRGSPPIGGSPAFDKNAWLGMNEGYGLGLGRTWEAGRA